VRYLWWAPSRKPLPPVGFARSQARAYLGAMAIGSRESARTPQPHGALPYGLVIARTRTDVTPALRESRGATPQGDGYTLVAEHHWVRIEARNPRGLLYGVYGYLQDLGVRFFAPQLGFYRGIGSEYVPRRAARIAPLHVTSSPAFGIRRLDLVLAGGTPASTVAIADWAAKRGVNTINLPLPAVPGQQTYAWARWRDRVLPALVRRGFTLESGRVYTGLLPFGRYAKKHPSWFSGPDPSRAFCASAPGALATYVQNVVGTLRRSPALGRFDAWPPDRTTWCPRDLRQIGPPPAIQARILGALQAAVLRERLHVQIETVAYEASGTLDAPPHGLPRRIVVDFAPYDRSFAQPLWAGQNARYWRALRGWIAVQPDIGLYSYYVKGWWLSRPVLVPRLIASELGRLAVLHLRAVSSYADSRSWMAYEINHLATAVYSWNAHIPYARFINDYTRHRFGVAASSARTYLKDVALGAQSVFTDRAGSFDSRPRVTSALVHWRAAARELSAMIAQVPRDGPVARLAGRLRTSVSLGILDAGTAAAELAGRPAAGPAFAAQRLLRGATNLGLVQGILPNQFSGAAGPRLLWAKPAPAAETVRLTSRRDGSHRAEAASRSRVRRWHLAHGSAR
jgi:hypothetical protein